MQDTQQICVGEILAPHGVRGLLRLRALLDDKNLIFKLPLQTAGGQAVKPQQRGQQKDAFLVALDGVADRTAADVWRGVKLFAPRAALPQTAASEFYVADLQGLQAFDNAGALLGTVAAVYDFGAGVSLEIKQAGQKPLIIPFNDRAVPQVDIAAGRLVVQPPEEIIIEGER